MNSSNEYVFSEDQQNIFSPSYARMLCTMYRMLGLTRTLVYLRDELASMLPIDRINALYATVRHDLFVSMADTSDVSVLPKRKLTSRAPVLLDDKLEKPLFVNNIDKYKNPEFVKHPAYADAPFLRYHSVIRIPLFKDEMCIFCMNFWSMQYDCFDQTALDSLEALLAPLSSILRKDFAERTDMSVEPAIDNSSSHARIKMCTGLASTLHQVELAAPTSCNVLLLGETGVGKESFADVLHFLSPRKKGPLIKVNCGAIPESLLASELFGHESGAFTGAQQTQQGYFEQANKGTIFLDEIGEMSLEAQVHLLRVLDTHCINRVGSAKPIPLDVRVIAATHDNLQEKVREGKFRKDLWYRLTVYPVHIPPLRERPEDIITLSHHFLYAKSRELGLAVTFNSSQISLDTLLAHNWPGNVRELEHVMERALIKNSIGSSELSFEIMPDVNQPEEHGRAFDGWPSLEDMEGRYIRKVITHCRGKLTGPSSATEILGIHYTTLRTKMRSLGIPLPRAGQR